MSTEEESEPNLEHGVLTSAADTFGNSPEWSFSDLCFWLQATTPFDAAPAPAPAPNSNKKPLQHPPAPVETTRQPFKEFISPADFVLRSANYEVGEPSGVANTDDNNRRRVSKKSGVEPRPRRVRSAEQHNTCEKIRRDRMNSKIHTLQELIPNCDSKEKESVLDSAIKHIALLQNQLKVMSMFSASTSGLQASNMFQENYQGLQVPQYGQYMQMDSGFGGMPPMYGMTWTRMPFYFPSPYQSNLVSSQMPMPMFRPILPQMPMFQPILPHMPMFPPILPQMPMFPPILPQMQQTTLNPFGSLPSTDTISLCSTSTSTSTSCTRGEGSSQSQIALDLGQLSPMIQGLAPTFHSVRVFPSQIVMRSDSTEEIQQKPQGSA